MNCPSTFKVAGLALLATMTLFSACKKETSTSTGWNYNDPQTGGFHVVEQREQETGPGLVFIEGGRFTMGSVNMSDDVMRDWNSFPRTVTVRSFYMDETEVRNLDYLEYLYWVKRVYGASYPSVYTDALPDTLVWLSPMGYNEPFMHDYLRHPAYRDYPVVGVSWLQATNYAAWRTDRVNEMILIKNKIQDWNPDQRNEAHFNTEAYYYGLYDGIVRRNLRDLDPTSETGERRVTRQDGILLPSYRLPTEAEWEFAALGLIGGTIEERVNLRVYPWAGNGLRSSNKKHMGVFMANFKRGSGDLMGVAGNLNDGAEITAPVYSYWPNDYGLYNMAGNVNEWVYDVYRPLTQMYVDEFNPVRGNVFKKLDIDENGVPRRDELGRLVYIDDTPDADRRNYRRSDYRDYMDGDAMSGLMPQAPVDTTGIGIDTPQTAMYEYGVNTLISNQSRVYKGGSWKDGAYWLQVGTRRFLNENEATNDIGFRCAMNRVGSPIGF